jgi:hypothetical protein
VLVVDNIAALHESAGGKSDNTWCVHLPVLEWGDGEKITSFEGNGIFNSILAKMEKTSYKFCRGDNALEDAVRWLQELPDDPNPTLLDQSDSADTNKGNKGEENVRVCIQSVYGENAQKQETHLVTGDKVDLCYCINGTCEKAEGCKQLSFPDDTWCQRQSSNTVYN